MAYLSLLRWLHALRSDQFSDLGNVTNTDNHMKEHEEVEIEEKSVEPKQRVAKGKKFANCSS